MYPSGPWRGHWEQTSWGRQAMHDLELHFADGAVTGRGVDLIGLFTFSGQYDERGNVALVKHYVGRHQVLYRGRYDGEGTIHGEWTIGEAWRGPFALSPEANRAAADAPILSVSAAPADQRIGSPDRRRPGAVPAVPADEP